MDAIDAINDQIRQKAHAANIRAIRQLQKDSARMGILLTRKQARQALRAQLDADIRVDKVQEEKDRPDPAKVLAEAKPEVARDDQLAAQVAQLVAQEMGKFSITGYGVSGKGLQWRIDGCEPTI